MKHVYVESLYSIYQNCQIHAINTKRYINQTVIRRTCNINSSANASHEELFKAEVQARARVSIGLRLGQDSMKTENKLGVMPHSYNRSTCETEAGITRVQGRLCLYK